MDGWMEVTRIRECEEAGSSRSVRGAAKRKARDPTDKLRLCRGIDLLRRG